MTERLEARNHDRVVRTQTVEHIWNDAISAFFSSMGRYLGRLLLVLPLGIDGSDCVAQAVPNSPTNQTVSNAQLNVNWLYGSYVPKEVPLVSLNGSQRLKLYWRQTYATPGIYIKTTLFATHDQVHDSNPEWGTAWEDFPDALEIARCSSSSRIRFRLSATALWAGSRAMTDVDAMAFGRVPAMPSSETL